MAHRQCLPSYRLTYESSINLYQYEMCYEQAIQPWCAQGSHYTGKPHKTGVKPCSQVIHNRERKIGDCWAGIIPCTAPRRIGLETSCVKCYRRFKLRDDSSSFDPPDPGYIFEKSDSNPERDEKTKEISKRRKRDARAAKKKGGNTGYRFWDSDSDKMSKDTSKSRRGGYNFDSSSSTKP